MRKNLAILSLITLCATSVACGGKNRKADETPTEQTKKTEDPVDMDEIPPEELANSPCGNPDWSRLPPQGPGKSE